MNFLAWHNILFLSSLGVGVLIAVGAATGGVDMDADADFDADVAGGLDAEMDAEGGKHGILSFLDLGQIPFTVLLMVSSLIFGIVGIACSLASASVLGFDSGWLGWLWVGIALAVMVFLTARIARLIIKHIPASETHVVSKADLVGVQAVMFTSRYANVNRDGTVHRLDCVAEGAELSAGMRVEVTDYDPEARVYTVRPVTA